MNVLLINGSPNQHGCTYTALSEVAATLQRHDITSEILYLGKKPIAGCIACMQCREKGHCVFDDKVNDVVDSLPQYDALVLGSPVYYAAPAGNLISFLNRLFFCGGRQMAGKLGASVVSCRRGGAASAFDQLNKYFTICNMPIVSSQYWNQVHGSQPDDVRRDEEGLQTMRTLGENMAWLLASIDAGRQHGVPAPVYEPHLWTNFIR
jgi:multimeric flavodoxin WrbA